MGCRMSIWLEHDDADEAGDALHSAEDLFCAAEQRFSRFLADSELTKLNEQSGQWVTVSRVMWQMLRRAHHLAEETSGLFDPTMLHSLEVAGYRNSFTEMQAGLNGAVTNLPHAAATQPTSLQGGWRAMAFDETNRTVRLPKGVKVDLGGIAKGATAQAAVDYLSHWGPCLVDAGGDLVACAAPPKLPGWPS